MINSLQNLHKKLLENYFLLLIWEAQTLLKQQELWLLAYLKKLVLIILKFLFRKYVISMLSLLKIFFKKNLNLKYKEEVGVKILLYKIFRLFSIKKKKNLIFEKFLFFNNTGSFKNGVFIFLCTINYDEIFEKRRVYFSFISRKSR